MKLHNYIDFHSLCKICWTVWTIDSSCGHSHVPTGILWYDFQSVKKPKQLLISWRVVWKASFPFLILLLSGISFLVLVVTLIDFTLHTSDCKPFMWGKIVLSVFHSFKKAFVSRLIKPPSWFGVRSMKGNRLYWTRFKKLTKYPAKMKECRKIKIIYLAQVLEN